MIRPLSIKFLGFKEDNHSIPSLSAIKTIDPLTVDEKPEETLNSRVSPSLLFRKFDALPANYLYFPVLLPEVAS
jgi:hypothetical protein